MVKGRKALRRKGIFVIILTGIVRIGNGGVSDIA